MTTPAIALPPELADAARPVVNTLGHWTRVGNICLDDEVIAAMSWAARRYIVIEELQRAASAVIARVTGAEAGCATNGAAGGLLLAIAATRARLDPDRIAAMPGLDEKRELVLFASHRSAYESCLRVAGVELVVVDDAGEDPLAALAPHLGADTAAVFYDAQLACAGAAPPLPAVVEAAHAAGVPVIVDASLAVPPRANLTEPIAAGADLVAYSGGKAIGGPGASGFLAGRADLIASALAQQADGDVYDRLGRQRPPGPVQMGIGRVTKTGKEEIVGMLVALDGYLDSEEPACVCDLGDVEAALRAVPGLQVERVAKGGKDAIAVAVAGLSARELRERLLAGDPAVATVVVADRLLIQSTECMHEGELELLVQGFAQVSAAAS